MAAMGAATVVAQTPAGALIDATKNKRLLMSAASLAVARLHHHRPTGDDSGRQVHRRSR
jgi:hypothetical protein